MVVDMPEVVVKPVSTRRQRKVFLEFPWTLYRDDPNWIPPLRSDQKEMVGDARHPFYERNRSQTFLTYRGGEVCGRIAAILNVGHIEQYNDPRGFFGFFECRDEPICSKSGRSRSIICSSQSSRITGASPRVV